MYWDDGFEKNLYITGLGTTLATNVKFTGQATIAPGYYAGYVLHLEAIDSDSLTIDQGRAELSASVPRAGGRPADAAEQRHRSDRHRAAVVLVLEERPPRQGVGRPSVAGFG